MDIIIERKGVMNTILEKEYDTVMKETVEPYLKKHRKSGYISSYDGIGKIHVMRYLAEEPKGVIVICHGYTESAPKYDELVYYFLQAGYHVYLPEHCGHGLSYRLTKDPSLVHIDNWKRYVRDFLHVCEYIRKKHPDLHLNLFAHSMEAGVVLSGDFKFSDDSSTYSECAMGDFCIRIRIAVFIWKK